MLYIYNANKRFFYQVIAALAHELKVLGYDPIVTERIPETLGGKVDTIIVFGFQDVTGKPDKLSKLFDFNLIVYNTEQINNRHSLVCDLKNADYVWDYSKENLKHLKHPRKYFVPIGYSDAFVITGILPDRHTDELNYFGTTNERRRNKITALKDVGVPFKKNDNVFMGRWDAMVRENQCFINIHYFPKTVLEVFRVVPLLANGCTVFSERSDDHELDALYEPYITFYDKPEDLLGYTPNNRAGAFKNFLFRDNIVNSGCLASLYINDPKPDWDVFY